jgi:hypothetical protein
MYITLLPGIYKNQKNKKTNKNQKTQKPNKNQKKQKPQKKTCHNGC